MLRWIAGLLSIIVLAGAYFSYSQHTDLLEARGKLTHAQKLAEAERAHAEYVWRIAWAEQARADSLEAVALASAQRAIVAESRRPAADSKARDAVAQAPDTCATYIAAIEGARDLAAETADAWRESYETEQQAAAALRVRGDSLASSNARLTERLTDLGEAADDVSDASRKSFFSHLIPKVGVGSVPVGYDPINNQVVGPVIGPTLSWSF